MYVLQRDDGAYVAPPGQARSYVRDITKAWILPSEEIAEAERTQNEEVVSIIRTFFELSVAQARHMKTKLTR